MLFLFSVSCFLFPFLFLFWFLIYEPALAEPVSFYVKSDVFCPHPYKIIDPVICRNVDLVSLIIPERNCPGCRTRPYGRRSNFFFFFRSFLFHNPSRCCAAFTSS